MTENQALLKNELSRPVAVADLGNLEFEMDILPSEKELLAVGARLKVDSLDIFGAKVFLKLLPSGEVRLNATFKARVSQICSITLQPVENEISSEFTTTYAHDADEDWGHDEEEFADMDTDIEPPEPIVDGKIDIGEAIVEQLALEIDPFPRVKGATFDGYSTGPVGKDDVLRAKKNPFAVLSKLKSTPETSE